jgi:hypothetical protein
LNCLFGSIVAASLVSGNLSDRRIIQETISLLRNLENVAILKLTFISKSAISFQACCRNTHEQKYQDFECSQCSSGSSISCLPSESICKKQYPSVTTIHKKDIFHRRRESMNRFKNTFQICSNALLLIIII